MSRLSFIPFCIEHYAEHISMPGNKVYELFKREGLVDFLREDYGDLHGMGKEYLMQLIDNYLGDAVNDSLSRNNT
ncbi:MAG: DUF3791 domain-containing protein [Clostridiales bacterium]|nr:DUF3791 domain-containing protein [Clostridiales bacterium]